jgi:integrase
MTALCEVAEDYLAMRRSLGFKLTAYGRLLSDFVAYLESEGAATVTADTAVAWAVQPADATPRWWSHRLGVARGFASHLHAIDPTAEVPPLGLLPRPQRRSEPHLYSYEEIAALMAAARQLTPQLRGRTYETLIGLLAVTGMRPGEALRLDQGHVDWADSLLHIVGTKFNNYAEVVVMPS